MLGIDVEVLSVLRRLVLANTLVESNAFQALNAAARLARAPGLRCSIEIVER